MSGFRLPGVVWAALLIALPMLSVWLEQYFAGAIWAAPVAGLLLIIAKVVEVLQSGNDAAMPAGVMGEAPMGGSASRNLWWG